MNLDQATAPAPSAARSPSFIRFLVGMTADLIGDQIWFIVLAWLAGSATDPATAATVVAVGTIPRMILVIPAGTFVDRWGALRMAQLAQVTRVVTMAAVVPLALTDQPSIVALMSAAFVFGVADAIRLPASNSLPRWWLAPTELARGQGLITTASRVSSVVSGPLTGFALATGGPALAVAINIVLFALAFTLFTTLRSGRVASQANREPAGLVAGFRYVGSHRSILSMLLAVTGLNVALIGPLNIGLVLRTQQQQWSAASLGLVLGVFGAAATVGALSLLRYRSSSHRHPAVAGLALTGVAGLAIAALGYTPEVWSTCAAAAVLGLALGPAGGILVGLVQANVATAYLGRVMALVSFSTFGLAPIALAGFGYLVSGTTLPLAFLLSGAIVIVVTIAALLSPTVRRMTFVVEERHD